MTRRCRWLLVLGCWSLSALVAPDSWESIGSAVPSTVYAAARLGPSGSPWSPGPAERAPDVRIAGKPRAAETPPTDRGQDR